MVIHHVCVVNDHVVNNLFRRNKAAQLLITGVFAFFLVTSAWVASAHAHEHEQQKSTRSTDYINFDGSYRGRNEISPQVANQSVIASVQDRMRSIQRNYSH